jgi:CRP-like cAMP-binding protein
VTGAATRRDDRPNRLLAALDSEVFAHLEPHLQRLKLLAGAVLYEPGARIQHVYFPEDCVVSLLAVLGDGGSAEVAVFGCEGVLGYASSLMGRRAFGRYIVQVPGTASRMSVDRLQHSAHTNRQLNELLVRYSEALLAQTFQMVACNAVHTAEARSCRWILSTQDRVNRDTVPLTHEFLAEMLGVQRSTVSFITGMLQSEGVIRQHRGGITIVDRRALEGLACECYGAIRETFERLLPSTYSPGR